MPSSVHEIANQFIWNNIAPQCVDKKFVYRRDILQIWDLYWKNFHLFSAEKTDIINWRDTSHIDSEDDYTGCWIVRHCQQHQSYSGLRLPRQDDHTQPSWTHLWNDSWVQPFTAIIKMIMMIIITVIITIIKINQRAWVKPSGDEVQADKSESSSKAVQKQRPVPYTEAALVREFKEQTSIKATSCW